MGCQTSGPDSSGVYEEETTTASEISTKDDLNVVQNNVAANALMEVVALVAIIGVLIAIIYAIVKYARRFKRSLNDDVDEVEYLNKDTEKEQYGIKSAKEKELRDKNNIQYRKL